MVGSQGSIFALGSLAIWALLGGAGFAQVTAELHGPSFVPDSKFQGSTLAGWHTLGQATWRAENGELIGRGNSGSGWLVLDHSYQVGRRRTPMRNAWPRHASRGR